MEIVFLYWLHQSMDPSGALYYPMRRNRFKGPRTMVFPKSQMRHNRSATKLFIFTQPNFFYFHSAHLLFSLSPTFYFHSAQRTLQDDNAHSKSLLQQQSNQCTNAQCNFYSTNQQTNQQTNTTNKQTQQSIKQT